jgi:hypothetical protein
MRRFQTVLISWYKVRRNPKTSLLATLLRIRRREGEPLVERRLRRVAKFMSRGKLRFKHLSVPPNIE